MSWSGLASNQTVSCVNLQDAVDTGVFSRKASIPVSSKQITKAEAEAYVYINTIAGKSSNQLVVKSNLVSSISAPYSYTMYYDFCSSGCIAPSSLIDTKDGVKTAGELQLGDLLLSDIGVGEVVYIERKEQERLLIRTNAREITVSDTHHFINENGEEIVAAELHIGSILNTIDGAEEVIEITSIGLGEVIDITVEDTHHYYANGFLSHNKACFEIAGWTSSSNACSGGRSLYITVYSPSSSLSTLSVLYGSTSGGAAFPFNSLYPYVYLSSSQWAQISRDSTTGAYSILSIGSCSTGFDYYTAQAYDCNGCVASDNLFVCFPAGQTVITNRYYIAQGGPDGFAYRITGNASPTVAYILSNTWGSFTTCGLACFV